MKPRRLLCVLALLLPLSGCALLASDSEEFLEDKDRSAESFYGQAKDAARNGNWDQAIERLEALQARFPFGAHAEQVHLDLIYYYYKADEMDSVIAAADRFIRLYPRHPQVAYAWYMKGSANMERGATFLGTAFAVDRSIRDPQPLRQAFDDFRQLTQQFPDSPYAEDSRYRLVVLRNQLAAHELHVADYYLRMGAYVAVAKRAKAVVENYQGTPAVRRALELMVTAYDQLQLEDLKQDALRVIELNYPDHPLLGKATPPVGPASAGLN